MKYKVQITEEITYVAEVEAVSEQEAVDNFYARHYNRKFVSSEENVDQVVLLLDKSNQPN